MRLFFFVGLIVSAFLLVACGAVATPEPQAISEMAEVVMTQDADAENEVLSEAEVVALPEVNPLEVTGDIMTAGSSTVFPLSERFQDEGYSGNITIDSIGSGAGIERFCVAGETDISNASRAIKDSEVESCWSIGREPIEVRVGTDALNQGPVHSEFDVASVSARI